MSFNLPTPNPAAKNVILAGVKSITLHDRAEVRGRPAASLLLFIACPWLD